MPSNVRAQREGRFEGRGQDEEGDEDIPADQRPRIVRHMARPFLGSKGGWGVGEEINVIDD
jgi:hypothetical protein